MEPPPLDPLTRTSRSVMWCRFRSSKRSEHGRRLGPILALGILLGGLPLDPAHAAAQRPDSARPVEVDQKALESARTALRGGVDPSAVARDMARTHRQGSEQTMAILLRAGMEPESVARVVMQETRAQAPDVLVWIFRELAHGEVATRTRRSSEVAVRQTVPVMVSVGMMPGAIAEALLGMYVAGQLPGVDAAELAQQLLALGMSPELAAARLRALGGPAAVAAAPVHQMVAASSAGQGPASPVVVHHTVAALLSAGYAIGDVAAALRHLALPAEEVLEGMLSYETLNPASLWEIFQASTDDLGLNSHTIVKVVAGWLGSDMTAGQLEALVEWGITTAGMGPAGLWGAIREGVSVSVPLVLEALSGWTTVQVLGTLIDGGFDLMDSVKTAADQLGMGALETVQVLMSKGVSAQEAGEALQNAFELTALEVGQILSQVFGGA